MKDIVVDASVAARNFHPSNLFIFALTAYPKWATMCSTYSQASCLVKFNRSIVVWRCPDFFFLNSKYVFFFIYCSFPKKTFWLAVVPKSGPNTSSGTITKSVTHSYRDDSLVSFYDHYFCCCGCLLLLLDYNAFHSIKKKSVCWFVKCLLYLLLMKFQ